VDKQAGDRVRPLARSLDPVEGESLGGYLLRLSCRLHISPLQLARLTGCIAGTSAPIGCRLLLDLDVGSFARATRLTISEAAALTFIPWTDRYPPVARSRTSPAWPAPDDWLFSPRLRYCSACLAGDNSPVQQQYGGPWKKSWHLPISFACPQHLRFLSEDCPQQHLAGRGTWQLITQASDSTLHPAQCRRPEHPGNHGRHRRSCGIRLDLAARQDEPFLLSPGMLEAQQRLLSLLDERHPAEDAVRAFTDIRVVTALLRASWPLGHDYIDPRLAIVVTEHVRQLNSGTRRALDKPPGNVLATAALLTAAIAVLDSPDLAEIVARHVRIRSPGRPSRSPWARVLARHQSSCSPALREAAEPATRAYRRLTGPHGPKAPARAGGYRPEHIPALLEQHWYDQHLDRLGYPAPTNMRRAGAVLLVQWAIGGSLGDAAAYLGIRLGRPQHSFAPGLSRWLREHGPGDFTAALRGLAAHLDTAPGLIDYRHRHLAMQDWCLDPGTWRELTVRLPPVPGPVQPVLDDRKRQEASTFIWACVTQGEPRFAPRPIEARQPGPVRRTWAARRGTTWFQLTRPDPLTHYAELRKVLIRHANHLASMIGNRTATIPATCADPHAETNTSASTGARR
jgi:hypothetical protein